MAKKYSFPKGPKVPAVVQTWNWLFRTYPFLTKCAQRYGETLSLHIYGFGKVAMFSDPKSLREIFTGDPKVLFAGEGNSLLKPFLGENSLLLLDGDRHLRERRLMLPPFHGERMRYYGTFIQKITDNIADRWEVEKPFDVNPFLQEISLEIILQVVFGIEEQDKITKI